MAGVVLTAGGRTAKAVTEKRTQVELFDAWDAAINGMLKVAAASHPARQKLEKMQAWLANEDNHWHDKYQERYDTYWGEKIKANELAGKLFDMAIAITALQVKFDDSWIRGLSALVGCDLYPHVAQQFALWAQRTGSDDLFTVVKAWQAHEYQEDQRLEESMQHEERATA
jgi:hypothetical protein